MLKNSNLSKKKNLKNDLKHIVSFYVFQKFKTNGLYVLTLVFSNKDDIGRYVLKDLVLRVRKKVPIGFPIWKKNENCNEWCK